MTTADVLSANKIRRIVLDFIQPDLKRLEFDPDQINDKTDLLGEGIVDSFGFLDLIGAVEDGLGLSLDLGSLDPDSMATLGGLIAGFLDGAK
jgi:acyl carrier protein